VDCCVVVVVDIIIIIIIIGYVSLCQNRWSRECHDSPSCLNPRIEDKERQTKQQNTADTSTVSSVASDKTLSFLMCLYRIRFVAVPRSLYIETSICTFTSHYRNINTNLLYAVWNDNKVGWAHMMVPGTKNRGDNAEY